MVRKLCVILVVLLACGNLAQAEYRSDAPSTVRLTTTGRLANIYFSNPEKLTYKKTPLPSHLHSSLLDATKELCLQDGCDVNHLFAQVMCIAESPQNALRIFYANIGWDDQKQCVSLRSDTQLPFANFVSRLYKEGAGKMHDIQFCYVNPSSCQHLALQHSEHILVRHLEDDFEAITDFFSVHALGQGWKIHKFGVLMYSSLDSCDACQEQLLQFFDPGSVFSQKVSAHIKSIGCEMKKNPFGIVCFFSTRSCKRSSYSILHQGSLVGHFVYNKEKEKFFMKDQPFCEILFPCSRESFDIDEITMAPLLVSSIR